MAWHPSGHSADEVKALLSDRAERARLRPAVVHYVIPLGNTRYLAYRPRRRGGVWHVKTQIDGNTRARLMAIADDLEEADGVRVLSYAQALERAKEIFDGDVELYFRRRDPEMLPHTLRVCPIGERYTVGHALQDYLTDKKVTGSRKGYEHMLVDINAYIVGDLAAIPCDELGVARLREWFYSLSIRPEGASNFLRRTHNEVLAVNDGEADRLIKRRANSILIVLKAALNMAWRDGKIAEDGAWRRLKPHRHTRKARKRVLSDDEIKALLAAAPLDLRRLILGALFTGCRAGELRELRPSDFNYRAGSLFVHATKTGRSRNIVLSYEAISFFERLTEGLGEQHPIFYREGRKPWGRSLHTRPMRNASADAGLEVPVVFHDLRHTYASRLIMAGVSPFVVADQLGHADCTQLIKTYGHVSAEFAIEQVRERSPRVAASAAAVQKTAKWHKEIQNDPSPKQHPISRKSIG